MVSVDINELVSLGDNQCNNSCNILAASWIKLLGEIGLNNMQVSACAYQVLGNEPNELPKVCENNFEKTKCYTDSTI